MGGPQVEVIVPPTQKISQNVNMMLSLYSRGLTDEVSMCVVGKPCELDWAEAPLPSKCPPIDSVDPAGETVFRFVESDPPTSVDFLSHRARGLSVFPKTPECRARSLSMWTTLEEAKKRRLLATKKNLKIAAVVVRHGDGVWKVGDTGHIDWWPCAGCKPLLMSQVVG